VWVIVVLYYYIAHLPIRQQGQRLTNCYHGGTPNHMTQAFPAQTPYQSLPTVSFSRARGAKPIGPFGLVRSLLPIVTGPHIQEAWWFWFGPREIYQLLPHSRGRTAGHMQEPHSTFRTAWQFWFGPCVIYQLLPRFESGSRPATNSHYQPSASGNRAHHTVARGTHQMWFEPYMDPLWVAGG